MSAVQTAGAMQPQAIGTSAGPPADLELIALALSGEPQAFEALMRRYNRTLYRTARAILRDDAEAEDVVQETWLRAYRALGTFRGESKLSTWLARIAVNEALMRRRRNSGTVLAMEDEDSISEEPGPEGEAQLSEARRLLERHIGALPDGFRTVFMLRALEEFTVGETAAALGIPEATVRSRYFRARGLLRDSMARDVDPRSRRPSHSQARGATASCAACSRSWKHRLRRERLPARPYRRRADATFCRKPTAIR